MRNGRLTEFLKGWSAAGRNPAVAGAVKQKPSSYEYLDELRREVMDQELGRHRQVVSEAIEHLGKSRCATQSKHVQRAKELLQNLMQNAGS